MIASLCMLECNQHNTATNSTEILTATTACSSHVLSISADRFVRIHRIADWKEVVGYECRSQTIECVDYIGLNGSPYFICPGGQHGNLLQLIHWKQIRLADQLDLQYSIVKIVEMKIDVDENDITINSNQINKKTTAITKTVIAATKNTIEIISVSLNNLETTFNHATLLNRVCSIPFQYNLQKFNILTFNQIINQNVSNYNTSSLNSNSTSLIDKYHTHNETNHVSTYGRITALSCSRSSSSSPASGIIIILAINNGAILKLQNLGLFQQQQQSSQQQYQQHLDNNTYPSHWVCIECEISNIPLSPVMFLWQNTNVFVSIHADSSIIQWDINTCQPLRSIDIHNFINNTHHDNLQQPIRGSSHSSILSVQISLSIGAIAFPDRIGFIKLDTLDEPECISIPSDTITAIVYSQETQALIIALKSNNNRNGIIQNVSHKPSLHSIPLPNQLMQFIQRQHNNSPKKVVNNTIESTIKTNLSDYLNSNNQYLSSNSPAVNPITEGLQTLNSQIFNTQTYNYTQKSFDGQIHLNSINLNEISNAMPIPIDNQNPFLQIPQNQQNSKLNHNNRYQNNNNNSNIPHANPQQSDDVIQPLSTSQSPYKGYFPEPYPSASAYIDSSGKSRLISKNDPLRKQLFTEHNSASPITGQSPSPSQYQHNFNNDEYPHLKATGYQIFPSQIIKSPWELMSSQQTRSGAERNTESEQTQKYDLTTKCNNTNSNTNVGSCYSSSSVSQQKQQLQQYSQGSQDKVKLSETKVVTQFKLQGEEQEEQQGEDSNMEVISQQYLTERPREYQETQLNMRLESSQYQKQTEEPSKISRNNIINTTSVSLNIPSDYQQKHNQQNKFKSYLLQTHKPEKTYLSLAAFKAQASKSVDLNNKQIFSQNKSDKTNLTTQMKSPNSFEKIQSIINQKRSGINKEKELEIQEQSQLLRRVQLDGDLKIKDTKQDYQNNFIDSKNRAVNSNNAMNLGKGNETQIELITNQQLGSQQINSHANTNLLSHNTHANSHHHHNHSTTLPLQPHQMQSVAEDIEPDISSENISETQETSFQALQSSLQQQHTQHSLSNHSHSSVKSRSQNSSMIKLHQQRDKSSNTRSQTFNDLLGKLKINSDDKNQLFSFRSNNKSKNSITDSESTKKRNTKNNSNSITKLGQHPQIVDTSDKKKKINKFIDAEETSISKQRAITSTTMFKKMMTLQKDAEALTKRVRNLEDESMYFRAEIADINRVNKRFQNEIRRYCSVSNMRSVINGKEGGDEKSFSINGNNKKQNQMKERKHSNKSFNGISSDGSSDQKRQKRALSQSNYISKGARNQTTNSPLKQDLQSTVTLKDKIMETLEVYKRNQRNESQSASNSRLHYRGILAGVPYYTQNSESARKKTQTSISNMSSYNNISRILDLQNKDYNNNDKSKERLNSKDKKYKNEEQFDFVEMNKRFVSPLKWNVKYSPLREFNSGKGKEEQLKKESQLQQQQYQSQEQEKSNRKLSSGSQNLLTTEFSALAYTEETGKKIDKKQNNQTDSIGKQNRSYLFDHKDQQFDRRQQQQQQYQQSSSLSAVSVSPVQLKYDFNNNNQQYRTQQHLQQQQPYHPSANGVSSIQGSSSIPKEFENCLNGIKQFLEQNKSDLLHLKRDIQSLADKNKSIKE